MTTDDWLAERFTDHRAHLGAVAFRMLGSASEAEGAVQEAWIRLSRSDHEQVDNLGDWLTTVVARICLDQLRSRAGLREEPLDGAISAEVTDPEAEVLGRRSRTGTAGGAGHLEPGGAAGVRVTRPLRRAVRRDRALLDGVPGAAWQVGGKTQVAFEFDVIDGLITEIELVADRATLTVSASSSLQISFDRSESGP